MVERCIAWTGTSVRILDQTKLPGEVVFIETGDYEVVAEAIRSLRVRGAPAIGVAAAYGAALGAMKLNGDRDSFPAKLQAVLDYLAATRPTAKNLFWALERMRGIVLENGGNSVEEMKRLLIAEAVKIHIEDEELTKRMGRHGSRLIHDGATVMTYCNTGFLATGGIGTALGVIYAAAAAGKNVSVYACETRPLLQGARLTCWELCQRNIPVTLICDNMAGTVLKNRQVDAIFVGADRIASNGDAANKIGTYSLAVNARHHGVPFYVVAPSTTFDLDIASGSEIPIEERSPDEVRRGFGRVTAPEEAAIFNPAFDVTPADLITGIITENGVFRKPYGKWD